MSNDMKNRQPAGIPAGGQFASTTHAEPSLTLSAPKVDPSWVDGQMYMNGLGNILSEDQTTELTLRLNEGRDFSDAAIRERAEKIHLRDKGYDLKTAVLAKNAVGSLAADGRLDEAGAIQTILTARAGQAQAAAAGPVPDGVVVPMPATDPRVQGGQVFEKVLAEDTVFIHSDAFADPDGCQSMRFQADRPLTDAEAYALSGVVGYANSAAIGGEPLDDPATGPARDSPYSFIVSIDTTKGRQRNYDKFEEMIPELIQHGSKPRSTMGDTRAIEPFGHLNLEVYYAK